MPEFLVKVQDAELGDSDQNLRLAFKRGNPVVVFPSGHAWGNLERLPNFYRVVIPDTISIETVKAYLQQWDLSVDYEVITRSVPQDGWRLRVFSTQASVADQGVGSGKITKAMVKNYLNAWNASVVSFADNSVRFDISVYLAVTSKRFWGVDSLAGVSFTEVSYNKTSGEHVIQADYHLSAFANQQTKVEQQVKSMGGTVTSHIILGQIITFSVSRDYVVNYFKMDVKHSLHKVLRVRRYYLPETLLSLADVDGVITLTESQFTQIKDRLAD